jgi:hypothetical protein
MTPSELAAAMPVTLDAAAAFMRHLTAEAPLTWRATLATGHWPRGATRRTTAVDATVPRRVVRHRVVRAVASDQRTPPFGAVALARTREPIADIARAPGQRLGDVALGEPVALKPRGMLVERVELLVGAPRVAARWARSALREPRATAHARCVGAATGDAAGRSVSPPSSGAPTADLAAALVYGSSENAAPRLDAAAVDLFATTCMELGIPGRRCGRLCWQGRKR